MSAVTRVCCIAALPATYVVRWKPGLCPGVTSLWRCLPALGVHYFHTSSVRWRFLDARDPDHDKKEKQLVVHQGEYFDEAAKRARDKQTYQEAVAMYLKRNALYRRGHVEFIYAALARMKEFNVHRDLATYKKLLGLFPEGKMIAQTTWQVEFMHYPKQQQCCIDILDQMESNGVVPDDEMGYQLVRIFGQKAYAFRKYQRMMYWMPKFKFANPYYVPYELPNDAIELAKMALQRMAVDMENAVSVHMTKDLKECVDKTFVVSAQSPVQRALIAEHPVDRPVFVEGGFTVWLRSKSLTYFMLRAEPTERFVQFTKSTKEDKNSVESLFNWNIFDEEKPRVLAVPPSVHEQEDGTVLATCVTGTSSKDSLTSWIRFLELSNPRLVQIPVVFRLRTPEAQMTVVDDETRSTDVTHS